MRLPKLLEENEVSSMNRNQILEEMCVDRMVTGVLLANFVWIVGGLIFGLYRGLLGPPMLIGAAITICLTGFYFIRYDTQFRKLKSKFA